jgi:hypothetical protein
LDRRRRCGGEPACRTARPAAGGAIVSLALTCASWLSLVAWAAGGPWAPLVPLFLLLGTAGAAVGLASALIERTRRSLAAFVAGCAAPITTLVVWVVTGPHDL